MEPFKLETPLDYVNTSASTPRSKAASITPIRRIKAIKFVEALKEGKTVHEAAKAVGSKARYMVNDADVKILAADLIAKYTLDAETRKKLSRARTNQIVMEGQDKDAIAALKVMNDDPEVGIGGGPAVNLNQQFNLSPATANLLQSFSIDEDETLPPAEEPNLIDAPAVDEPNSESR